MNTVENSTDLSMKNSFGGGGDASPRIEPVYTKTQHDGDVAVTVTVYDNGYIGVDQKGPNGGRVHKNPNGSPYDQ